MMRLLVQHVFPHFLHAGCADREGSVTFLLGKAMEAHFLFYPSRRFAFEFPHDIRQTMRGAQTGQYMDVISDAAHGMRSSAQAANDSAEIFMDTVARLWSEPQLPAFCAPNKMVMQGKMHRSHTAIFLRSCRSSTFICFKSGGSALLHHRLSRF